MYLPDNLPPILAKSTGETLYQHTWHVLERFADQVRLRPMLPDQVGQPRLWHHLYWAALFHDLGKATPGFQQVLHPGSSARWLYRHEVGSLAFLAWLPLEPTEDDYRWLVAAIVSHHKDAPVIREQYKDEGPSIAAIAQDLAQADLAALWQWLDACANRWIIDLGCPPMAFCRYRCSRQRQQ
ncbi:MAG: CRISPR-associated endonuclease Cas3'' [Chloroflexaceae bacterium]|nr:CRISPR-associated endonuclease Cas3'' [Chloroflexaceae bacterium]NJO05930.1 CRISPR-associated endonuclease Cas3'' [Chloroflexaceae bacterium]